jgi:type II secretory pathway component PulF
MNSFRVTLARVQALPRPRRRFPLKEQIFFIKRLSFLVKAGVPLMECIDIITKQTRSPERAKLYQAVSDDLASGQYLATSLGKMKRGFSDFAINIIRVGETSGILTQNLNYLAEELTKQSTLKRKVLGALVYPAFITVATLGVTSLITVYIFPKIMPIFTSLNVELPITTRVLIAVSLYLREWGLLTLGGVAVVIVGFFLARAYAPAVRAATDRSLLSIPLAGRIARGYNLANFTRTLGLMLRSGVPVTEAMEVAAETTPNLVYRAAYERVTEGIIKGESVSQGLAREGALFPDLLTHMVAVGETTGSLSNTLTYLSELYETEVDELTKNLSTSIEPILMIVMGLLVGLIAVSVITPIYEITQHLNPK